MAKQSKETDDDDYYETDPQEEIHLAIVNNDLNQLQDVCRIGIDVNEKFSYDINPQHFDMTPLALAAALDRRNHVKVLLDHGADINAHFTNLKTTALMTASFHGHVDVVNLLLERGANPQAVDLQCSTALGYCFGGSRTIDVVGALLKCGVDVNQKNMLGMNALLLVAGYGNDFLVRMILEHGANPNSVNDFGHTALHLAVVGKRSLISSTLSGRGTTSLYGLNRRNLDLALIDWAHGHMELLSNGRVNERELEKSGKFMMDISQKLKEPETVICIDDQDAMLKRLNAVSCYYHEKSQLSKSAKKSGVMDTLLSCGGRRSKQLREDASGNSSAPLERLGDSNMLVSVDVDKDVAALSNRCARIVKFILDAGCDVNKTEYTYGMTALDMAIVMGDVESTVMLLAAGGDSDHLLKLFAMTDLHKAITRPDKKKVRELINNDPHVDVNGSFLACNIADDYDNADKDQVRRDKIDLDKVDEGLTPLAVASKASDNSTVDIIKMLLNKGADINKIGLGGRSPLGEACRLGNKRMVEFLLGQGADLEATNPAIRNATATVIAVINKQTETVEYLISKGAKIDRPMTDNRTSLIMALDADDMRMIDILLENSDLKLNFCDRDGFMFRMAEKYKEPNRDIEWILHEIRKQSQFLEEQERKQTSATKVVKNQIQSKLVTRTYLDKQTKLSILEDDDNEEEEEEEEEEESNGEVSPPPPTRHQPPRLSSVRGTRVTSKPRRPLSIDSSNCSGDDLPTSQSPVQSKRDAKNLKSQKSKIVGSIANAVTTSKKVMKSELVANRATSKFNSNLPRQSLVTIVPLANNNVQAEDEVEEEEEEDDDDSEEEDEERDEEEEGKQRLQLATTAPLSGVQHRSPNVRKSHPQQPQEMKTRNTKVLGNSIVTTTVVTQKVATLSKCTQPSDYKESEEDDDDSEEEDEDSENEVEEDEEGEEEDEEDEESEAEEEEEETDDNGDDEERKVGNKIDYFKTKRKPDMLSSNYSTETDI